MAASSSDEKRSEARNVWQTNLTQLLVLAQKDRVFLQREIDEIFAKAHLDVEQKLLPRTIRQAGKQNFYSDELQQVLGVGTLQDLRRVVHDYQDALELSKSLIQQYNLPTH
jgi:predicted ATPase